MSKARNVMFLGLFVVGFNLTAQNDYTLIARNEVPPYDTTNVITCFEKIQDHYKSINDYYTPGERATAEAKLTNDVWEDVRSMELYNHLRDSYITVQNFLFGIDRGTLNLKFDISGAQVEEIYYVEWQIGAGGDINNFDGLIFHISGILVNGQLKEEFILLKEEFHRIQRISKGLNALEDEWPPEFTVKRRLGVNPKVPVDPDVEEIEKAHLNLLNNYYDQIAQLPEAGDRTGTIQSSLNSLLFSNTEADLTFNYVEKQRSSFDELFESIRRAKPLIQSRQDKLINRFSSTYTVGSSRRQGVLYEVELYVARESVSQFVLVTKPENPSASKIYAIYSSLTEAQEKLFMSVVKDPRFRRDVVPYREVTFENSSDLVKRNKEQWSGTWSGGDEGEVFDFNLYDGQVNLGALPSDQIDVQGNQMNWAIPQKFKDKGLGGRKYRIEVVGLEPVKSPVFRIKKRNTILWNLVWAIPGSLVALDRLGVIDLGLFPSKTVFDNKPTPPCPPGVDNCN